jgi:hypothetical protein
MCVTHIPIARFYSAFCIFSSIRTKRTIQVVGLRESTFAITADITLVTFMRLDELPFAFHFPSGLALENA